MKKKRLKKCISLFITKVLLSIIFLLISLIYISSSSNKDIYKKYLFEDSISFAKINNWYQNKFGSIIPLEDVTVSNTEKVFNESIEYDLMEDYLNGKLLKVKDNYMVPTIESGVVVFIGNKDSYGNTCIIQGIDGVDIWYSNIDTSNIDLYDYIKKGTLIGPVKDNNLFLLFMRDSEFITYEKYNKD